MSLIANLAINLDARGALQGLRTFYQQSQSASRAADQLKVTVSSVSKTAAELGGSFSGAAQQAQSAAGGIQRYTSSLADAQDKSESAAGAIDTLQASTAAASEAANATSGEFDKLASGAATVSSAASPVKRQFVRAANGMKYYVDAAGRVHRENGQIASTSEAVAAGLKKQTEEAKKAGDAFENLEDIAGKLGIALSTAGVAAFAGGIIGRASTFEGELRKAAAIEGGGNFDQLRQDVERVAAAAAGTPTEVAALATALSRAGFTATETGQAMQGIVQGAEATAISFENMGSITGSTLRAFGMNTSETQKVVDILVKSANSADQTVQDLGEALKYSAPVANSLGVSVADLAGTIAILANNGIRGSEAGTALRTGLEKLQLAAGASEDKLLGLLSGNKQLADSMKALGVSVTDASGKLKPLDDVLINLKRGLEKFGPGIQSEILQALFGEEAGGKLRAALNSSEEDIRKLIKAVNDSGGTAAKTQKEMEGFAVSMNKLGGNIETVSNAIGDKFIAVLNPMVQGLSAALAETQKLPKPLRDVAAGAAAVGIAVGGVTLAVKTLIPVVTTLAGLLGIGGLGGLIAAGPWIALAAGVAAAAYQIYQAANAQQQFNDQIAFAPIAEVNQKIIQLQDELAGAEEKLLKTQAQFGALSREAVFAQSSVDALRGALEQAQGDYRIRLLYQEVGVTPTSGYYGPGFKAPKQETKPKPTVTTDRVPAPVKTRSGSSSADKAAQQEAQLQSRLRGLQIETQGTLQLALIKGKIAEAEMAGNKELAIWLQGEQRNQQILLDLQRSLEGITDERERQALLTKAQAELESVGMDTAIEMERRRLELIKEQNDELFKRAGFTPQDKMRGGAGAFDPSLPDLRVSPAEQQMAAYREELAALTNPINMAVTGADAIGSAFGQAFQDIATGAKSTQEALADAFKGIGEAFIQMATQIIAKQLAMIAFQAILKALGGGGGGFGFSGAGPAALPSGDGFAAGFSMPALLPGRANGGPVSSNTPYIVGERGPELFVPSSSGSVMSNADTRAALAEQSAARSTNDTRAMLEQQTAARQSNATGMALQQKPIDVRYESTVINRTEYVTADQHRKGLAQAAERGRALTLAALQNSTRTRKKVGI